MNQAYYMITFYLLVSVIMSVNKTGVEASTLHRVRPMEYDADIDLWAITSSTIKEFLESLKEYLTFILNLVGWLAKNWPVIGSIIGSYHFATRVVHPYLVQGIVYRLYAYIVNLVIKWLRKILNVSPPTEVTSNYEDRARTPPPSYDDILDRVALTLAAEQSKKKESEKCDGSLTTPTAPVYPVLLSN